MPENTMKLYERYALEMHNVYRLVRLRDDFSVVRSVRNDLITQTEVLGMFPEINPRFFDNFGVVELTIRMKSGTTLHLKKVR